MDIKFDVSLYSEVLGTLYKDNEIDLDGLEAKVDLNLDEVNGMAVNFEVGGKSYTDYVEIKDRVARTVQIPFKTSVLKAGNNSFELVATMKNGDVKTSRTYAYQIVKSLENPNAVEADTHYPILIDLINQVSAITANGESGGESSGHTHHNKTVLDGITSSKVNEWNNKADKTHTHSQYLTALPTHNHSYNDLSDKPVIPSTEGLATESYVQEKIAEASLSGGEVDLSAYATKAELNTKADKTHTHNELHSHSNKTVLDEITSSKVNEWNNKSTFNGDYNSLTNKPVIPSTEGLATESYVQEKIAEASLSGSDVDLSDYATKEYVNIKVTENTDKITVLNANINGRYTNQQIDEKVSEIVVTKIDGDLVFRDVLVGETFEINEDNVPGSPTVVYGNIVISTTTLSFNENTTTTFTVKLDEAPTNDQVVNLSVNNAYCTLSKTSLTFTSSNYSTVQTVTVTGVHDSSDYSNQTSIINLTSANVANKTISVTIKNVDTPPAVTIPVTGVSLSQPTHTMEVGQTIRLTAAVSPSDATNKNVTWGASNSNATVIDGLVSAKNEGECIITVTTEDGNKKATCQIVIEAKNENDGEHPIDVIPVIDLDVANWDETTTLTDKCGNYHFTIGDVSKYTKLDDGGVFIASSSPARSTFATPGSYSVRIKMKFTQLPGAYGRFWRWENDTPSLYVEAAKQFLTFKAAGSSAQAYRISTTKTYVNELVDVVCCFDGATKEIGMYINGEKVGFQSGTQASGGGNTLTIGNIDTNAYNIDFAMYAFQVYDTALSEDQIRGL